MIIVLLAFLLRGITGFGGALICVPLMSLFLKLNFVLPLEAILELVSSLLMLPYVYKRTKWKMLGILSLGAAIGTVIGVACLENFPESWLKVGLGVTISYFGIRYFLPIKSMPKMKKPIYGIFSGIIGGTLGGVFGTSGPPYVIWLTNVIDNKDEFYATLIVLFAIDIGYRIDVFGVAGYITNDVLRYAFWCLITLIPGSILGFLVLKKLNNEYFKKLVALLMLISGIALIIIH